MAKQLYIITYHKYFSRTWIYHRIHRTYPKWQKILPICLNQGKWTGEIEQYALLVASLCHDLGHFGRTNQFLVEIKHARRLQGTAGWPGEWNIQGLLAYIYIYSPGCIIYIYIWWSYPGTIYGIYLAMFFCTLLSPSIYNAGIYWVPWKYTVEHCYCIRTFKKDLLGLNATKFNLCQFTQEHAKIQMNLDVGELCMCYPLLISA